MIWPRCTARDAGGDVEGEETFAEAGVRDEERDAAERDSIGPEPADFLRDEFGETHGASDALSAGELVGGCDEGARGG